MSNFKAEVVRHSISQAGKEMTSFELVYPRFIHPEHLRHRALSFSVSSSRAIPSIKLIEMVRTDHVSPIHWGKNQKGMQASQELDAFGKARSASVWHEAALQAADAAEKLMRLGAHKQIVNRVIEPYLPVRLICTATEWANFYALRRHADAQPEIRHIADLMWEAQQASTPRELRPGEWHLPYVLDEEVDSHGGLEDPTGVLRKVSAARCARASYKTHDGRISEVSEDLELCERLIGVEPIHASPFEHQATPDWVYFTWADGGIDWRCPGQHGNLVGWRQARKFLSNENITHYKG